VFETTPATPELPLPPWPAGQFALTPRPILLFQSGLTVDRKSVKLYVVPLLSLR